MEDVNKIDPNGMNPEEQSLWMESLEFLGNLAERLKKIQVRITASDESGKGKLIWRLLHAHGSAKYNALAQELLDWTHRFDVRLVGLPWKVRFNIKMEAQARSALPCLVAQRHVDMFHSL